MPDHPHSFTWRAIIDGLNISVEVTLFLIPAVYPVVHCRRENKNAVAQEA